MHPECNSYKIIWLHYNHLVIIVTEPLYSETILELIYTEELSTTQNSYLTGLYLYSLM